MEITLHGLINKLRGKRDKFSVTGIDEDGRELLCIAGEVSPNLGTSVEQVATDVLLALNESLPNVGEMHLNTFREVTPQEVEAAFDSIFDVPHDHVD